MKTNQNKPAKQVFINCPFDNEYQDLFRTLVFTLIYMGYYPIFSITESSSDFRLKSIIKLIRQSGIGIHDLSRHMSLNAGEFSRFNLPFELGLDMGKQIIWWQEIQREENDST